MTPIGAGIPAYQKKWRRAASEPPAIQSCSGRHRTWREL